MRRSTSAATASSPSAEFPAPCRCRFSEVRWKCSWVGTGLWSACHNTWPHSSGTNLHLHPQLWWQTVVSRFTGGRNPWTFPCSLSAGEMLRRSVGSQGRRDHLQRHAGDHCPDGYASARRPVERTLAPHPPVDSRQRRSSPALHGRATQGSRARYLGESPAVWDYYRWKPCCREGHEGYRIWKPHRQAARLQLDPPDLPSILRGTASSTSNWLYLDLEEQAAYNDGRRSTFV